MLDFLFPNLQSKYRAQKFSQSIDLYVGEQEFRVTPKTDLEKFNILVTDYKIRAILKKNPDPNCDYETCYESKHHGYMPLF